MENQESEAIKSLFNDSNNQIFRLNNCYNKCNYYSVNGQYDKWRWELDVIWRELSSDIIKLSNLKSFAEVQEHKHYLQVQELDREINKAVGVKNMKKLYELLHKKEMFLRYIQNEVGKGSKYLDPLEDGIDE